MLDLYKLKIFDLVVQEASFSGTARILHMTQSGVSQHMRDLETYLGIALFERNRRGVTLTKAGKTLHKYSLELLHIAYETESAVRELTRDSTDEIIMGVTPGISNYLMPNWIQSFHEKHPNLRIVLQTSITSKVLNDIIAEQTEIGFVEGEIQTEHTRVHAISLGEIEQFVVVGRDHHWWEYPTIRLEALNAMPFISRQSTSQTHRWLDALFQAHNIQPQIIAEFDNLESIKRSLLSGVSFSIMPQYTIQYEQDMGLLRAIPIEDVPLVRELKVICRHEQCTPIAKEFLNHVADILGIDPLPITKLI